MNCLCAFLLLAFATVSVHSSFSSSPDYCKPVVEKTFKDHCTSQLQLLKINSLQLGSVTTILSGLVTKVTGVSLSAVALVSFEFDGFIIDAVIGLTLKCNLVPAVNILITIHAELYTYLDDGCGLFGLSLNPTVVLSINGVTTGLDLPLIKAILAAITVPVTGVVAGVLDTTVSALNCLSKSFTEVIVIGGQPCYYELSAVNIVGGLQKGTCCLNIGGVSVCPDDIVVDLIDGVLCTVGLSNNILYSCFGAVLGTITLTVQVPALLCGDLINTYAADIYLRLSFTDQYSCSFVPDGVAASLQVNIELYVNTGTETVLISATAVINVAAGITQNYNYWCLVFETSIIADLDLTVITDTCDCQNSILPWFKDFASYNLVSLLAALNYNLCFPVPLIGGITPTTIDVVPQQNSCYFNYT